MTQAHSQIHPANLIGILADRPLAVSVQQEGITYYATDTAQLFLSVLVPALTGPMTWVLIGGAAIVAPKPLKFFSGTLGADTNITVNAYLADGGNGVAMSTTPMGYPAGQVGFTITTLTVNVTNNKPTTPTSVTLLKNGIATGITVSIPGPNVLGQFVAVGSVVYAPGDTFDLLVSNSLGGTGNSIRMSAEIT